MNRRNSQWLSNEEHAYVRANLLRLRVAHHDPARPLPAVPSADDRLDEITLARLALTVGVSARELATDPDRLARSLTAHLEAAQLFDRRHADDGRRLLEAVWTEARRLGFVLHAGQAADLLGTYAMWSGHPLDAVTWLVRALLTPWGLDVARRADLVARLGSALMATERYDVAHAVLASVDHSRVDPAGQRAMVALAGSLVLRGHSADAAAAYREVLKSAGSLPPRLEAQTWVGYGAALGLAGDIPAALRTSDAVDELMARHDLRDLIPTVQANETWAAAVAAPWQEAQAVILTAIRAAEHPYVQANLYDTLVYVLARAEQWEAVCDAANAGLRAVGEGGGRSRLLKARLLWTRAVAASHLGRDGAARDREWALDLLELMGAVGHLDTLPPWPDDPASVGAHDVGKGAEDPVHFRQGVVGSESEAHGPRAAFGFEPEIPVVGVEGPG
jgi:hypothetical protein